MSAIGQILGLVESKVAELLEKVTAHEKKQDARLDALEKTVAELTARPVKSAAPAPKATARAGTATAKGQAQP